MAAELEFYKTLAPQGDWIGIVPEIALCVLALIILLADLALPPSRRAVLASFAIWPQVLLLAVVGYAAAGFPGDQSIFHFNGMLRQTQQTEFMRVFFLLCSILVSYGGSVLFTRQRLPVAEFFVLVLIATASIMLLVQSNHFVLLFVTLETLAICLYVMVSYCRKSPLSLEAGLKYLITSALSAAILLFGIVLLYGAAGNPMLPGSASDGFDFLQLEQFVALNPSNLFVITGGILVLSGILFKIAAVPFQIWASDVYQGAPTPVTAFLAVASKAAGFVVLLNVLHGPLAPLAGTFLPILKAVAVLTLLFGSLAALGQRNVKRLMGLSGIAQAGYLLLGVCASYTVSWAPAAIYLYLFVYLLASFGVFSVMTHLSPEDDALQDVEHYRDLFKRSPFLGTVLAVGLGSLAGIPPLAGFAAKLLLFIAAFQAGLYWLLGFALLSAVLSIYYYFGWLREAAFTPSLPEAEASVAQPVSPVPGFWARVIMGTLSILTVIFGFWQGGL